MAMLFGGFFFTRFVFVVDGGYRAVLFDKIRGVQSHVYGEGMHFRIPILQDPKTFEIRTRPQMIHSSTGTRDLQNVELSLRILFKPMPEKIPEILNNIGIDYDERIIPSIGNEVLKSVIAQYNAEELLTQREKVSLEIHDILQKRAQEFDIILDDVSITHLQFSRDFSKSIEEK
jgi:regulator of protease activity HflC (stomatin/prohibitin superfamily)